MRNCSGQAAFPVARNALIVIARYVKMAALGIIADSAAGGGADGIVAAWSLFLQSEANGITGFAASIPELQEYLKWLYAHLDAQDAGARDEKDE